ncbi:hypothetical protein ABMY26_22650 [Azospirillum sp. HJ39]|uniref:hypothetical protein n=1 Tax=Azospirillum sp. HJ39 TaxID=3159496 RepID=UPI003557FDF5
MTSTALLPRPDQIAELTRGLDLPLPPIDDFLLSVIADGVVQAFKDVRHDWPNEISTGNEDELTTKLQSRLNAMIDDDPLWGQLVASVGRGQESLNFDGSHLHKRPDLTINLTARTRRFPLTAEAKIIDASKGENLYCSEGIRRFLNGEYSWGSREAFMIAYVRDGSTIATRLEPYLSLPTQKTIYAVEDLKTSYTLDPCDTAKSRHSRSFVYTHMTPPANAPGSINLWHLWVDATIVALP